MVTHTIWYSRALGGVVCSVDVQGATNEQCLIVARALWETLYNEGFHMVNAKP